MKRTKELYEESLPVYYWQRTLLKKELEEINYTHYLRDRLKQEEELNTILDTFFNNIQHNKK